MGEKSPGFWHSLRGRIAAAAPVEKAGTLVDPAVASHYLGHPLQPKADEAGYEADHVIDQIILQRQELAVEQREVEEADGKAQNDHVEQQVPPWPPGRRERAAGEPGGAAAHEHAHQEED